MEASPERAQFNPSIFELKFGPGQLTFSGAKINFHRWAPCIQRGICGEGICRSTVQSSYDIGAHIRS